jgi:hypothetical protein
MVKHRAVGWCSSQFTVLQGEIEVAVLLVLLADLLTSEKNN